MRVGVFAHVFERVCAPMYTKLQCEYTLCTRTCITLCNLLVVWRGMILLVNFNPIKTMRLPKHKLQPSSIKQVSFCYWVLFAEASFDNSVVRGYE